MKNYLSGIANPEMGSALQIRDRARKSPVGAVEQIVASQKDPVGYRSELLAACADSMCTFGSIASVLQEDGGGIKCNRHQVNSWWSRQPESTNQ
jgi:hypothetical protein